MLVGEQAPRVVDGRSQAAVPFRHVAHRRGEEVDVALDLVRDLGAGEDGHPRGRELYTERHTVDEPTDAERLRVPGLVEGEARYDLCGPLDEEAHCRGAAVSVLRETEALDVEHPLALDVQPLPRRGQDSDLRCAPDHLAQKGGALDEMLEVVEHEQHRALAEVVEQLVLRREVAVHAVEGELDRLGEGGREEVRRRDGRERYEVDAVRVAVDAASGGLEREPGLAGSARSDEREQAALGVLQQPVDRFEFRRPADERRSRQGEVLHARLERLQQRELARQAVDLELVDALRRAEILEAVHAQVADVRVNECTGRLRQEHLPAVPDGGDTRALVHVEPDVTLVRQPRLARVQPHAHANRPAGKCALAVRSGGDGVRRAGEGDEKRITLRVDLDALVVGKRRAESPPMLVQRLPVVVAELMQQPRRALHVREQQSHDTARETAHHRTRSCADARSLSSGQTAAASVSTPRSAALIDNISWPARGPNAGARIGSTMRSGDAPCRKVPANVGVAGRSSLSVVVPDSACHAGGRGFESRRSRFSMCLQIGTFSCHTRRKYASGGPIMARCLSGKRPAKTFSRVGL